MKHAARADDFRRFDGNSVTIASIDVNSRTTETGQVSLRLSCKRRRCHPALGDGCVVGPDMAVEIRRLYSCGGLLALFFASSALRLNPAATPISRAKK